MNKPGAEINEIHKMSTGHLRVEAYKLRSELRGFLTVAQRAHKLSRERLVSSYLRIRTAKEV